MILENAVESRKSTQHLNAPDNMKNILLTAFFRIMKNRLCFLFSVLLLLLAGNNLCADQQLDSLKQISAAGAPLLTLKMLDQAQPAIDKDLYEWILWEQERYQILARWKQWNDLLVRIEDLPEDLPEQFLQQAASYRIRAYISLGQNQTARQLLREQLWKQDASSSSEYREWRKLVVETYLNEQQIDDARVSMLRLQQDFVQMDRDWILLRARVLMEAERYDEAIVLLLSRLDWQSLTMRLLAEYRNQQHSAKTLWDLCQKRIAVIKDDQEQLATYWSIAAIAAKEISPQYEVLALEARLGLDVTDNINLYAVDADQLWQAYFQFRKTGRKQQ